MVSHAIASESSDLQLGSFSLGDSLFFKNLLAPSHGNINNDLLWGNAEARISSEETIVAVVNFIV